MALLQEITIPLLSVNDTTLTILELSLSSGSAVKKGDLIMVLETSKTSYDVEAPGDGYIQYCCEADQDYAVNTVVARIYSELGEAQVIATPAVAPMAAPAAVGVYAVAGASAAIAVQTPEEPPVFWEGETLFSRQALRLIESQGLDKSQFAGRDLVTAADVQAFLRPATNGRPATAGQPASSGDAQGPRVKTAPVVDHTKAIVEKLSASKRREIEYLADIQQTGLTSTVHIFVDTEGIFTHLNRALNHLKDSLLPVIIYESSRLLADYPLLNAWYAGEAIAVYREVSAGFAIDIDKGLKVLKIEKAAEKSVGGIEADILRLSGQYLDDSLRVEDLTDITFTITDLSGEGIAFFRPLINKMNSSILGVSAIDEKLQRCVLSLTFDHRVTDGKGAARFLSELKQRLESYRPSAWRLHQDIACFKCFKTLKEDLGGTGLVRCVTTEGKDGYICQTCLKGF
ncbi:MAG TPA: 2-oxo acid dehydrogenase subunit E2 [Puia sp.]|nr:2-oxo acid dehydrogenase subunit E2 [Puia sp.]